MPIPEQIAAEITEYFEPHMSMFTEDYVCVYGSSTYCAEKTSSDVDLFLVTHDAKRVALDGIIAFTKDFHVRHGRKIDEEVPYENKIHYNSAEIEGALQLNGFKINEGRLIVPKIRKEIDFLKSPQIKSRLALNALTTPHHVISNGSACYQAARSAAEISATLLATQISGEPEFDVTMLYDALTVDDSGNNGEMYLGYKTEYDLVHRGLITILETTTERLADSGIFEVTGNETFHCPLDANGIIALMKQITTDRSQ